MPLDDVYLVSPQLELVPEAEIDQLEATLGFPLPVGYREYLQTLGKGSFCHILRVLTPAEVLDKDLIEYWQESLLPIGLEDELWDPHPMLSEDSLKGTMMFAQSDEGDCFVTGPELNRQLFEFPRHESRIYHYPEGFLEPFKFEFCRVSGYNLPFFWPPGGREAQTHLELREDADPQEIWDYVATLSTSPLRVAEGEIGRTDRVVAFIPDIAGCAWLDSRRFEFSAAAEHAAVLEDMSRRFQHLTSQ